MEVLILSPFFSPNIGGVETHLDDLVEILKAKEFKSYVLTYQPLMSNLHASAREQRGNTEIYRVEWLRNLFYMLEPYPLLDFLYLTPRLLLSTFLFLILHPKCRVVHAQGINAACIAVLLKPLFKLRVIVSTHAVYEFSTETTFAKITKLIFSRADKILALLQHSKHELVRLGINERIIEPYTYWVDQNKFIPENKTLAKEKLLWNKNEFHIVFVGRIFEKKGIIELIDAAKLLKKSEEHSIIHIIGTGPLENFVQENSKNNSNLNYIGKLNNDQLPIYYQAADAFIIPSTHEEGAGRVIMEALSCGTPVVGSDRGGIPEVLNPAAGVGILIEVSPENIVDGIVGLKNQIKRDPSINRKCREYAESAFSVRNADKIIKTYYTSEEH